MSIEMPSVVTAGRPVSIRTTAGKLGLPHLTEAIDEDIRRADEGKLGHLDFLDLVLPEELAVRDGRRFRQVRLSRLPHHTTLGEYDFAFQPDLDPCKVKDSRQKRNLR